jgi:hypothetical protein
MKKLFLASILISLLAIGTAWGTPFTLTPGQLLTFYETYENPTSEPDTYLANSNSLVTSANTSYYGPYTTTNGAIAEAFLDPDDATGQTFQQIQIGVNFWGISKEGPADPGDVISTGNTTVGDLGIGDLSSYDKYQLIFKNLNDDDWMVQIYMNTGWTDPSWGETDHYYQNTWTTISPGESATLTLDFSSAETWGGGYSGGLSAVQNLNHVTNIGFNIGTAWDSTAGAYHYNKAQIEAAPIPEPGTLLLLGFGLSGLAAYGWHRKKKSKAS